MKQNTLKLHAGDVVYHEGDQADRLYIIKSGTIRLCKAREGRVLVLATLTSKEIFGTEDIFRKSLHSNNAIALENSELVVVSADDIRDELGELPRWISKIMQTLARRLDESESILENHKIYDSKLNDEFELDPKIESLIKENLLN